MSTFLLFFAVVYLLITSAVLLRNRFELTPLSSEKNIPDEQPLVSVCIPARNEERTLGKLLQSLTLQDYPHFEVLVLDDHSEDRTAEVIQNYKDAFGPRLIHLNGTEKPDSWLGKPWACQQLGEAASGEILLFLDADTLLEKSAVSRVAASFENHPVSMITVWPRQILKTFWENSVLPLVYYALLTLLPAIYVFRDPRWMPRSMARFFRGSFAAANGQCIAFRTDVYREIGGHHSVHDKIVEDVELARSLKTSGYRIRMFQGCGTVSCRMYTSEKEMFAGFRKNFLAGFGYSIPLFVTGSILHLIVFIFPFLMLFTALLNGSTADLWLSVAAVSLIFIHRFMLSLWFQWDPLYSLLHPIGVLWFQRLGIRVLADYLSGKKVEWKGRKV